jgi:3-hydroxyacyl-[acyl-carrier-protein] dehydratase
MEIFKDITCSQTGELHYTGKAGINGSHAILKAHFPGSPIVPGVVLLQFVSVIFSKVVQQKVKLVEVGNVKFVKPVIPEDGKLLSLDLNFTIQNGTYTVNGSLYYEDDITGHFKNLLYHIAD